MLLILTPTTVHRIIALAEAYGATRRRDWSDVPGAVEIAKGVWEVPMKALDALKDETDGDPVKWLALCQAIKDLSCSPAGRWAVFHALTSDGGFGKSQLAIEYAFRHRRYYAGTWFIDASSAAAADRDGRNILIALGEPVPAESDAVAGRWRGPCSVAGTC